MGIQALHSRSLLLSFFLGVVFLHPPGAYPSNLQAYHTVVGAAGLVPEDLQALSLASGDLDGDGIADLAAGFADGLGRGRVGFFRLPSERIYPDSGKKEKIAQESNWPFEEPVWLDLPAAPDWLELIDVDRDGRRDLVAATRGEPRLFWLKRKGAMEFESPRDVALSGDPVLMRVLDVPRSDGWPDLVVGLEGSEGPSLLLFTHPHQLFQDPEVVQLDELPVDVARMRLGAEHRPTLVVASGQKVLLLSELTRRLKENPVEATVFALTTTPIRSLVAGQFDVEKPGEELAVLGEEGDIQFLAGTGLPCSKEVELSLGAHSAVLVESRVAAGVATPLVVLDKAWGTARVLTGEGEEQRLEWLAAGLGSTVAVEAMRLNPDGLDDLVILSKGPRPLQVVETQGSGAFVVNLESDERDFSLAKDAMGVFHCDIDNDPANGDNCTLTAALQQANADPDPNTIVFAVDQVVMEKALPRIRDTVTIDGMEPKEGRSEVRVEIDAGSKATEIFNFDAGSEGSVIRGMVLRTNFGGVIKAAADEITIEGNYVATDRSGMNPMSLGLNHGVLLRGSNSTVGGLVTAARNVLGNGVRVDGGTGNTVLNNYIGTAADGLKALGSGVCGVTILGAGNEGVDDEIPKTTDNTIGSLASNKEGILGNLISGNFCGVEVRNAPGNRILGNWIGSDKSGQRRLTGLDSFPVMGNLFNGVEVVASNRTEITGNVIVASGRNGVRLGVTSTSNVNDNIVGVNAAGTFSDPDGEPDSGDELGNRWSGIAVDGNDDPEGTGVNLAGNRIQGNLFGGNLLNGISLNGQNNTVFGNRVGVSKQALELGNGLAGAVVFGSDNRIGGEGNGEPNTIAHNQGDGVTIRVGAINNSIIANSIFENGGIGIDLETARDGVTENDPDDSDEGPNQLQNFPFVIAADADSIRGNLPGSSGRIFRLEFFSNESCDESGHGEGATLIGFILCAAGTDAQCLTVDGDLTFETPFGAPAGKQITATATEFVGGLPGNTSEFSKCVGTQAGRVFMVNSDGDETDSDLTAVPARPFDGLCDTGKRFPDGSLECTLRAAIAEANSDKIEDTIQFAVKDLEIKLERPLQVTFPAIIDGAGQNVTISPIFPELDIHALMISAGDSTVRGLTIKGFPDGWAITLEKADGNTIQGNTLIENLAGITIRSDSNDNQIGGVWEGDACLDPCNLISANSGPGIAIFTDLNRVQGNFIGVDRTGTRRRGNDGFGVWISSNEEGKGSTNEIGGTRRGQGNLISANGWGIQISDQDPSATPVGDNVIQGNRIGTDRSGLQNLGNARCGICIGLQVEGRNQIGEKLEALADDVSLEPPAANIIAFNDVGVEIEGPGGGTVLSNSIFSNRFSNLMYCQGRKTERCPPLDKFFPRPPEPVLFGATVHCDQVCKEDPNVQGGIRVTFKLDTTRPLGEDPGGRRFTFQTFSMTSAGY